MTPKLIIIRGNSASGKSTVAKKVRESLGDNTMFVQQDVIRREMLFVKDRPGNPAVDLIAEAVLYGKRIGYDVILEGILSKKVYLEMLKKLMTAFTPNVYTFYLDVSFDETVRRHETKPNRDEYGHEKMKEWWLEKDYIAEDSERIIPESFSLDDAVAFILQEIRK